MPCWGGGLGSNDCRGQVIREEAEWGGWPRSISKRDEEVRKLKEALARSERERRDVESKLEAAESLSGIINGRLRMAEERQGASKVS